MQAAEHALRLASGLPIRALDTGAELRLRADSICVHGDKPSAVAQACGVRDALLAEGFTLCPLPEVVGSRHCPPWSPPPVASACRGCRHRGSCG